MGKDSITTALQNLKHLNRHENVNEKKYNKLS